MQVGDYQLDQDDNGNYTVLYKNSTIYATRYKDNAIKYFFNCIEKSAPAATDADVEKKLSAKL